MSAIGQGSGSLRFAVLGPVKGWCGDRAVDLGPARQQAVLAALLLHPNVSRSAEDLLAAVWGLDQPGSGRNIVSVYLYRLRAAMRAAGATGEVIQRSRGGYRFAATADVDAARLDDLVDGAASAIADGRPDDAEAALTEATGLFTGEPLAGLPGTHAAAERRRLGDRRLTAWRELAGLWIERDRVPDAIDVLTRLVTENPYDEPMVALLMRAHYRGGWVADALRDYRDLRDRMVGDLGVEPGHEVRELHQSLLCGADDAAGPRPPSPPPVPAELAARNELPPNVPHLEGRDAEADDLLGHLAPRTDGGPVVLAVLGIAGVGKSALVVRVAHLARSTYPDGALFVDLHGHTPGREPLSPGDGLARLLRTVGVPDRDLPDDLDERAALWRSVTAGLRLLLVLDNAASGTQVLPLLPGGSGSAVLVTSRVHLADLDADRQLTLDALPPDAAIALLGRLVSNDRADAEPDAAREVVRLCGALPLALRIAAARLRNRPQWTFRHLAGKLADGDRRLTELSIGSRGVESAFALSYSRLPEAEQRVFRLLGEVPGILPDRHSVAALAGIEAADADRLLESIADVSLLDPVGVDRYRLHDLVADYTRKLAAARPEPEAPDRLLGHHLAMVRAASALLTGAPAPALPPGAPFHDLDSAADWVAGNRGTLVDSVAFAARTGRVGVAADLTEAAADLFTRRAWFGAARRMHETALTARPGHERRARLLVGLANVHGLRGAYQQAWDRFEQAMELYRVLGDEVGEVAALGGIGTAARSLGRDREAAEHLTRALAVAKKIGSARLRCLTLCNLGMLNGTLHKHDLALEQLRAAVALSAELGELRVHTAAVCALGELLSSIGAGEAVEVLTEAHDLASRTGDDVMRAFALTHLGTAAMHAGDPRTAINRHHEALEVVADDAVETVIEIRTNLGEAYLATGADAAAREQFVAVVELTDNAPSPQARARALAGLTRCAQQSR